MYDNADFAYTENNIVLFLDIYRKCLEHHYCASLFVYGYQINYKGNYRAD